MSDEREHVPVLLKEVLAEFRPEPGKRFIDATIGFAGHAQEIFENGADVLGIDWDPEIVDKAKKRLSTLESCCPDASWQVVNGNFRDLEKIAKANDFFPVDGVLFDLGISRWHYLKAQRGFSFDDENLDMRISPELDQTAADIVNSYSLKELDELFAKLVQEKLAQPIAQALVSRRRLKEFDSGEEVAGVIKEVYQENKQSAENNPATKVFLALRIAVNKEIENLKLGLEEGLKAVRKGGKVLVITFHSSEDRVVKFFGKEKKSRGEIKETKLIFPSHKEISQNRLARSAKLRVIEK